MSESFAGAWLLADMQRSQASAGMRKMIRQRRPRWQCYAAALCTFSLVIAFSVFIVYLLSVMLGDLFTYSLSIWIRILWLYLALPAAVLAAFLVYGHFRCGCTGWRVEGGVAVAAGSVCDQVTGTRQIS